MKYTIEINLKSGCEYNGITRLIYRFLKTLTFFGYEYALRYEKKEHINFERIICEEVSNEMGLEVTPEDLRKDTKKGEIVSARQICIRYRNLKASFAQSAKPYGRDRATAFHSKEVIKNRYNTEKQYREMIQRIEARTGKKLVENI